MTDTGTDTTDRVESELLTGECVCSSEWGEVRLEISTDGMEARVVEVDGDAEGCRLLNAEKINALLQDNRITHGVIAEAVTALVHSLVLDPKWQGDVVVAEGCPPTVPGGAEYTLFAGAKEVVVNGSGALVDGEPVDFLAIKEYLASSKKQAGTPELVAKTARAGAVLVAKKDPVKGEPGYDVFGRVLSPPGFMEVALGDHVQMSGDETTFVASLFGYPVILERRLSLISPIVVADDCMTAWYVQLPQLSPYEFPLSPDITALLKVAGLKKETAGQCVDDLVAQLGLEKNPGWYVVAQGRQSVAGLDGALLFEGTDPPSALRDDGSIDYKVLNLVKTVEAGSHFATLSLPTKGEDGFTLIGEVLPAEPGKPLKVDAKANVRVEERDDGEIWYYAETEGVIDYQNGKLEIDPLYQVKGNVDFGTGNIDVDCCLLVAGNVCSDFTVQSSKDIVVNGTLEPGSKLIVQGDLQVKGGIIGAKTEVVVMGNLQADFVQDAKIVVKGQILINQYVFSAVIRSVGSIQVGPGTGERGGSIVGGTICSSARIEATTTGSPSNVLTTVVVEPAPHKLAKLKQLKTGIGECETSITKILRTLGLRAVEPEQIKQVLQEANPKQRALYVEILQQLRVHVQEQQDFLKEKNKMRDRLWLDVDRMSVLVQKKCYANTKVRIAKKELVNRTDRGRTSVRHDRTRLCMTSGSGDAEPFG